ncbi:MAG: HAD family phosphatase [Bacteroidetes bacterium]|nr:MAG: HAD family phosphatase [Bacteroidota bacterium]
MSDQSPIDAVVFDLGGVLIDWNPEYLFRKLFDDPQRMRWFLTHVCTPEWNEEQDAGRPLAEGTELLVRQFPDWEPYIRAYYDRWEEMLGGAIEPSVAFLRKLKERNDLRLLALTNWTAETFPVARRRFDFLDWFEGIVVSGEEGTRKPFPEIYRRLIERYRIDPQRSLFIDDNLRNIEAAQQMGFQTLHFTGPEVWERLDVTERLREGETE